MVCLKKYAKDIYFSSKGYKKAIKSTSKAKILDMRTYLSLLPCSSISAEIKQQTR